MLILKKKYIGAGVSQGPKNKKNKSNLFIMVVTNY